MISAITEAITTSGSTCGPSSRDAHKASKVATYTMMRGHSAARMTRVLNSAPTRPPLLTTINNQIRQRQQNEASGHSWTFYSCNTNTNIVKRAKQLNNNYRIGLRGVGGRHGSRKSSALFQTTTDTKGTLSTTLSSTTRNKFKNLLSLVWIVVIAICVILLGSLTIVKPTNGTILMRVCDTREIKTVTDKICMLYKRTKNSDVRLDRQGNMRITRDIKGDYSPAKLASDCCKIGCPPHIFAYNCE